ncbi:BREX system Lon protease-like protein BrxL [Spirulina subsalsa]|uniref:BREX system Lon protease-like protein BrxL n=1 Tax=Spirulina subsalsa TaxID=54311 RepID=UPI00030F4470|nr:BREX system Lon protease-like protein BrxL [Spirulina subsalsa]
MNNISPERPYNNQKIRDIFGELSIDKRRLPSSGLTSIGVPSFVAEWLLDKIVPGEGELTPQEHEKVNRFVQKAFPRKDDREEIKFDLKTGQTKTIIALMQVRVKFGKGGEEITEPFARIPTLGFDSCMISTDLINENRMLLRQGIWGKITLSIPSNNKIEVFDFDPFQCSLLDRNAYANFRAQFSNVEEWKDLLFCSMGYNPEHPSYTPEAKTWMLARLIPLVERNYHVMELAPKGTGKSFVFENINSKVAVLSGGKVTRAQLFINGRTKEIGALGRHDVLVLDEVQSLTIDNPDEFIGPLKTYLANGSYNVSSFSDQPITSDCSLVMLANIELTSQLQPRNPNHLVANLPRFFSETALLDRICGIIPGWKIPKFQQAMIASQVGLKMDFFGEALLALRSDPRFEAYAKQHTNFDSKTVNVRDEKSIIKSASGLLKLLYPHLELTPTEYQEHCLKPAVELRQYIRNSLYHLDDEFRRYGQKIICT